MDIVIVILDTHGPEEAVRYAVRNLQMDAAMEAALGGSRLEWRSKSGWDGMDGW